MGPLKTVLYLRVNHPSHGALLPEKTTGGKVDMVRFLMLFHIATDPRHRTSRITVQSQ